MPRVNDNWWQWEPEEESNRQKADDFKANSGLSPEESAWKQAMMSLPPVGPAARSFFEAAPTPTPLQPKAPPEVKPTSGFDWGKALSGVGEAIGSGLGAAGEAIGSAAGALAPVATSQIIGQWGQAKPNPLPEWTPAWAKAGLSETTPQLASRAGLFGEKAKAEAESILPPEETRAAFNPLEQAGEMLVSFIADPITYLSFGVGGMVGKVAFKGAQGLAPKIGAGVVKSSLGMGGISAAHSPLQQIADTGQVDLGQTGGDIARGLATGAAFGIAGEAANIGLAGVKNPLLKQFGQFVAEVTTMGTVPAGMEGRMPTVDDYIIGAGMVLGMKAGGALPRLISKTLPGGTDFEALSTEGTVGNWFTYDANYAAGMAKRSGIGGVAYMDVSEAIAAKGQEAARLVLQNPSTEHRLITPESRGQTGPQVFWNPGIGGS
ncbi:MAG: hypothetical protein Q8P59_14745, partial [Dehalococcoidia bacterium]|nr:hypothetical protein [Dehalococcoidia bacterium]